jgi:hypothetical protein
MALDVAVDPGVIVVVVVAGTLAVTAPPELELPAPISPNPSIENGLNGVAKGSSLGATVTNEPNSSDMADPGVFTACACLIPPMDAVLPVRT